jgi:hypothetical protein
VARPDAAGNVAAGTIAGHKWFAALESRGGEVSMIFSEQADAFPVGPKTTTVSLTHAPNHQGSLSMNVSSESDGVTNVSEIAGAVRRGSARVVRGTVTGHAFTATVVDPGAQYAYDVYAAMLPFYAGTPMVTWTAVAYDSAGKRVASFIAP